MKVVIDIPEEIYNLSRVAMMYPGVMTNIPLAVIFDGIPLPENHGRLIDADKLLKRFESERGHMCWGEDVAFVINHETPTVLEGTK